MRQQAKVLPVLPHRRRDVARTPAPAPALGALAEPGPGMLAAVAKGPIKELTSGGTLTHSAWGVPTLRRTPGSPILPRRAGFLLVCAARDD